MALNLRTLVWLVLGRNMERRPRRKRRGPARDWQYRAWIRTLPCAACGSRWCVEAAHTGSDGGMSQKASDFSCVPLCKDCHTSRPTAYHRVGKEEFQRNHGIDFIDMVRALNSDWNARLHEPKTRGERL